MLVAYRTFYSRNMVLGVEETDLAGVAAELKRTFGERPPVGYVVGKTMFTEDSAGTCKARRFDGFFPLHDRRQLPHLPPTKPA